MGGANLSGKCGSGAESGIDVVAGNDSSRPCGIAPGVAPLKLYQLPETPG
jgi:hypothetical protein